MIKRTINSLYIHIPFCSSICSYCAFYKILSNKNVENTYINQLIDDINKSKELFNPFKTIYIGGGTPSSLSDDNLYKLLDSLQLLIAPDCEFTIEANPESINEEKLNIFKKYRINRISIGFESFNKDYLKLMNRNYDINYFDLIEMVKKYFSNINVDLIYGLPNENIDILNTDIDNFLKLNVPHISLYSLEIHKGTTLCIKGYKEENDDALRNQYDLILSRLRKCGYERYEVSNFAKIGYESKHNLNYWHDNEYLSLGVGGSGFVGNVRYKINPPIHDYLLGKRDLDKETVTLKDDKEYYLLTNLRLKDGFSVIDYQNKFNSDILIDKKEAIDKFTKLGLLIVEDNRLKVTDNGMYILDSILVDLI
jgi:oxygen-independent coproporphyrinogen III oxidase